MERRHCAVESVVRMKVVILAGGMGTRISEESRFRPKPMVEIGGKPILWHIMKWYSAFGFQEFIICCGYKGHIIKEYFLKYYTHQNDILFHLERGETEILPVQKEPWKVTLVNTGLKTKTAGRLLKVKPYIGDGPFMLTYGDGVSDVNIYELLKFHNSNRKIVTITTTQPAGRFGAVQMSPDGLVKNFKEKARKDQCWVNAGFMVMESEVFSYLGDGSQMLEDLPFEKLAEDGQMDAYRHPGFWSPMDTVHDREYLESMWEQGEAPWKPSNNDILQGGSDVELER